MKEPKLFALKIVSAMVAFVATPFLLVFGLMSCQSTNPTKYYKIERLNMHGDVLQTYYSNSFPDGSEYIYFREYPSGKWIKFSAPFNAECLGTNKPSL